MGCPARVLHKLIHVEHQIARRSLLDTVRAERFIASAIQVIVRKIVLLVLHNIIYSLVALITESRCLAARGLVRHAVRFLINKACALILALRITATCQSLQLLLLRFFALKPRIHVIFLFLLVFYHPTLALFICAQLEIFCLTYKNYDRNHKFAKF